MGRPWPETCDSVPGGMAGIDIAHSCLGAAVQPGDAPDKPMNVNAKAATS